MVKLKLLQIEKNQRKKKSKTISETTTKRSSRKNSRPVVKSIAKVLGKHLLTRRWKFSKMVTMQIGEKGQDLKLFSTNGKNIMMDEILYFCLSLNLLILFQISSPHVKMHVSSTLMQLCDFLLKNQLLLSCESSMSMS